MKLMVIGNGAREHAIVWKLAQNEKVEKIYCVPGNGGTAFENKCENRDIKNLNEIAEFAENEKIDLTFVGPEAYLVEGIVDIFNEKGLKIIGPDKNAAQMEGSKVFAKDFMKKYDIKTAEYGTFTSSNDAVEYLEKCVYPIVIKADGLAAGKGVYISETKEDAIKTVKEFMDNAMFGEAGKKVVIEEFLDGVEVSILAITDGKTMKPMLSAKDHKKAKDNDEGLNTGGMGCISPNPYYTEKIREEFELEIMNKTLEGMKKEGINFKGIVFFGLMITKKGTYVLEYNVRMGDPETEVVLPMMKSDMVELLEAVWEERLGSYIMEWEEGYSCCVVGASEGYPLSFEKGFEVKGVNETENKVFIAGAQKKEDKILTSSGRVLCTFGKGKTLEEARAKAYEDMKRIKYDNLYYRTDIGIIR